MVAAGAILMMMYRGLATESEAAAAATNNSSSLAAVDGTLQAAAQAGGIAIPISMLVGAIALVMGVALLVGAQ